MTYAVTGLLMLCVALSALLIAGSRSALEGVAIVVAIAVPGFLYGLLAVWSDERAHRDESDGRG